MSCAKRSTVSCNLTAAPEPPDSQGGSGHWPSWSMSHRLLIVEYPVADTNRTIELGRSRKGGHHGATQGTTPGSPPWSMNFFTAVASYPQGLYLRIRTRCYVPQ